MCVCCVCGWNILLNIYCNSCKHAFGLLHAVSNLCGVCVCCCFGMIVEGFAGHEGHQAIRHTRTQAITDVEWDYSV